MAANNRIVIGSANFPENSLVAALYAEALRANGVDAATSVTTGDQASNMKQLRDGAIDLIPEYSGVLLRYLDGQASASSSEDIYAALKTAVPSGFEVLEQSAAEDKEAIVITKETADANSLKSLTDLAPLAPTWVLGGPPEFPIRPDGIPGLHTDYGLTFKGFQSVDLGGPVTVRALKSGQVQAADLFTTDPAIAANDFVALQDPKNDFAAQNLVPLIRSAKVTPAVATALNAVSARLDTATLIDLDTKVSVEKLDPASVAREWVAANVPG